MQVTQFLTHLLLTIGILAPCPHITILLPFVPLQLVVIIVPSPFWPLISYVWPSTEAAAAVVKGAEVVEVVARKCYSVLH